MLAHTKGILGINARNQKYIRPSGFKRALRIIDRKLRTKRILREAGIPVPETYITIRTRRELFHFPWETLPPSFTLKPNRGHGGQGILIVYGKKKNRPDAWVRADKSVVEIRDLQTHILNIFDGYFSLTGLPDIAFFEKRLKISPFFKPFAYKGLPDIRVIIYNKIPVMAELRLPTKESGGRANLHTGAIGVGIDLSRGETTNAIIREKLIDYVPGSRLLLRGIKIPHWEEILQLAVRAQIATGVGFLGVDVAVDRELGPVVLELNTRPGLSIQIANLGSLGDRLERAKGLRVKTPARAVRIAKELFGETTEEDTPEREILGVNERVVLRGPTGISYETIAKVDTGAYRTSIAREIAEKIQVHDTLRFKIVKSSLGEEERPIVNLALVLGDKTIYTDVFIADRSDMKREVIVGRKDIKEFLIDPSKHTLLGK